MGWPARYLSLVPARLFSLCLNIAVEVVDGRESQGNDRGVKSSYGFCRAALPGSVKLSRTNG